MADKTYEDVNGNVITVNPNKTYEDVNGNNITYPSDKITNRVAIRRASPTRGQPLSEDDKNKIAQFGNSMLPMVGSFAGPEGTLAGLSIKKTLQGFFPKQLGDIGSLGDLGIDAGKELLFNNAIPGAVEGGINLLTQPKEALARGIASRIPFTNIKPFADTSNAVQRGVGQTTIDEAIGKLKDLAQTPTTVPGSAGADNFNTLFSKGMPNGNINPDAIIKELNYNKEDYKFINPAVKNQMLDLASTIKDAQATMPKDRVMIPYGKRLAIGALTAPLGGFGISGPITGTLILGEMGLKRVMADPEMAQLVTQAIKTPRGAPEASLLTKGILAGLKGTTLIMRNSNDKDITVSVGQDGQLQYPK